MASLGNASASTPGASENRVWQKSFETLATRQAEPLQTLGGHQENGSAGYDDAVDCLLAAGSGPASGFLEVSAAYSSSKAVQNFASPTPTDFIFDSQSQRFVMGDGPLGHDSVLHAAGIAPSDSTVGGTIWNENGSLMTDEWSGHYGQNWTPGIRQQFQSFMQQNGVNITHTPWGQ